jgi:hypothetical protein
MQSSWPKSYKSGKNLSANFDYPGEEITQETQKRTLSHDISVGL